MSTDRLPIPLTAWERQQLSSHRTLQMQQYGAPTFIDDVPEVLGKLAHSLRTLMVMSSRQPAVAEALSQASIMVIALATNISDALLQVAEAQAELDGGAL